MKEPFESKDYTQYAPMRLWTPGKSSYNVWFSPSRDGVVLRH